MLAMDCATWGTQWIRYCFVLQVQEMVAELFGGKKLNYSINPDEAIAYGAAIQGNVIAGSAEAQVWWLALGRSPFMGGPQKSCGQPLGTFPSNFLVHPKKKKKKKTHYLLITYCYSAFDIF